MAEEFAELSSYEPDILTQKPDGKYLLDLKSANAMILKLAGLRDENITVSEHCTYEEEELFFSRILVDYVAFLHVEVYELVAPPRQSLVFWRHVLVVRAAEVKVFECELL